MRRTFLLVLLVVPALVQATGCRRRTGLTGDGRSAEATDGAGGGGIPTPTGGPSPTGGAGGGRPEALAWARWPMPNPSTAGLPNPQSYDTTTPGVVVDNVTGLAWQRARSADAMLWKDARAACADLVLGGHDDWRLPGLIELVSIVDFTRQVPALDGNAFSDATGANFWSATPLVGSAGTEDWYLAFSTGFTYHGHGDMLSLQVRCVRDSRPTSGVTSSSAAAQYSFPAEGMVLDTRTGLTWQRTIGPETYAWSDALSHCAALSLGGLTWRLPSMKELQTLLDLGRQNPALDPVAFPGAPSNEHWTSSPLTSSSSDSWYVNFWFGITNTLARTSQTWARCVH